MPANQINPADDARPKQYAQDEPEPIDYGAELDAAAILSAEDRPMEKVATPKWGGHVYVRTISGYERDQFDRYMARHVNPETSEIEGCNWRSALLATCLCNSRGEPLFGEEDIEALGQKGGDTLDELFAVARRLNRMDQKDIEELKKASAAAQPGCSQPDSAETSEDGGPPASASET